MDDGADPDDLHGEAWSPLFIAAGGEASGGEDCLETLQLMIEAGGDPTRLEEGDSIFLFVALLQREPEVVGFLIEQGADPCVPLSEESQQRYGVTDLSELAAERNSATMAKTLEGVTAGCSR